jgi:hypothetical protein
MILPVTAWLVPRSRLAQIIAGQQIQWSAPVTRAAAERFVNVSRRAPNEPPASPRWNLYEE